MGRQVQILGPYLSGCKTLCLRLLTARAHGCDLICVKCGPRGSPRQMVAAGAAGAWLSPSLTRVVILQAQGAVLCRQSLGPRPALGQRHSVNLWLPFLAGSTGPAASGGKRGRSHMRPRAWQVQGVRGGSPGRLPAPCPHAVLSGPRPSHPVSVKGWRYT